MHAFGSRTGASDTVVTPPPVEEFIMCPPPSVMAGSFSRMNWRVGSSGTPVRRMVTVTSGPTGMPYTCELRLEDGRTVSGGRWALGPRRPALWVGFFLAGSNQREANEHDP